jgi:hypothetical protein
MWFLYIYDFYGFFKYCADSANESVKRIDHTACNTNAVPPHEIHLKKVHKK